MFGKVNRFLRSDLIIKVRRKKRTISSQSIKKVVEDRICTIYK